MAERALHIGVDGRELAGNVTGVGRYLRAVLSEWARMPHPHRFTIFIPGAPPPALEGLGPAFTWTTIPDDRAGTMWEQFRLPHAIRASGADVFFAPGYTAPLRMPCPLVVLIHDVSFFAHPEWFTRREGTRRRWLTRATARRATTILTVSDFSASEIARWLSVSKDRIRITPGAAMAVPASESTTRDPGLVLFVGSLFNRRHIPALMRGFAAFAASRPGARLVLVGDNRTQPRIDPSSLAAEFGIADRVEWRQYVDDDELNALYARASAFAFLSDYEGFALTPLEAIAHGVPPVLLDTVVAHEIYADAALFTSIEPAAIASALTRLTTAGAERAALVAAGRARLEHFSWPRTAALILDELRLAAR